MNPIFINLDITGARKQSDIITIVSSTPQIIYYRLYEGKYEIDYSALEELRLILDDQVNGNVYTLSSNTLETIDDTQYVKITVPPSQLSSNLDYEVRPVYRSGGINKGLIKFKMMVRDEEAVDISTLIRMYRDINNIFSRYLSSIKRHQIGEANGVVPLDGNSKVIESYIPDDILNHIKLMHEGHGLRLDRNYFIEYWDTQDNRWYLMNLLYGGEFGIARKESPTYSYHGGFF